LVLGFNSRGAIREKHAHRSRANRGAGGNPPAVWADTVGWPGVADRRHGIRVVPVRQDSVAAFRGQGKGGAVKRQLADREADRAR